jgi:arginine decarboxylase
MDLVDEHGTPLNLTYLPKIMEHIEHAKSMFAKAMKCHKFQAKYTYCCSAQLLRLGFMLDKALSNSGGSLEVSSATEISIVWELLGKEKIANSAYMVCNGFKSPQYTQ